jgi:hypothetical protein
MLKIIVQFREQFCLEIRVITKLPNSEAKVARHIRIHS